MIDSIRAAVLFGGTALLVVAAILFGQAMSGETQESPLVAITLGVAGFVFFVIGLCMPKGTLMAPSPRQSGIDVAGLEVDDIPDLSADKD